MLEIYLKLAKSPLHSRTFIKSIDINKPIDEILNILLIFFTNNIRASYMPMLVSNRFKSDAVLQQPFTNFFKKIFEHFNQLVDASMVEISNGSLFINLSQTSYNQAAFELLEKLTDLDNSLNAIGEQSSLIHVSIGQYSSGQREILSLISSLWNKVLNIEGVTDLSGCQKKSVIIIIDEYEKYLHPEWIRRLFSYFMKFGTYLNIRDSRIKLQFILSTHSPYLISDLPKENIILLEKNEETGKRTARKSNYGFASNYYDIMSDSFFLDDTIGEFAKQKINGWLNEIKKIQISKKSFEDKNKKLDQLKENLLIIGDEFLKNELIKQVNLVKDNIFNEISNVDKIVLLEKQIIELKGKERND